MAPIEQSGSGSSVQVTFQDDVAFVTMKRGENRINEELCQQLLEAFDKVLANPKAKAMVTTGVGRFYSNGLDLDWLSYIAGAEPDRLQKFSQGGLIQTVIRILTFPLPTVAMLNGHAYAGGAILSLAHDYIIMQEKPGWWCLNEVHIKLRLSEILNELVKQKIPSQPARTEATVLGRRFTGPEAEQAGVIHECCPADQMVARAMAWINKIHPTNGFDRDHLQAMKEDLYSSVLAVDFRSQNVFKAAARL